MSPVSGVSAATAAYAVLGHPVRHSLSPMMQTSAFAALGLDACYLAFDVPPGGLADALSGAYALGFSGLNVTVPHKREAFELAAEVDETAQAVGAANTLVRAASGWRAHNTDVGGFIAALGFSLGFDPAGRRAVVLGAGGAARGAVYGLVKAGAGEVLVAARDHAKASAVAADFGPAARALHVDDVPAHLAGGDLLVSATPVGLDAGGDWPWPVVRLGGGVLVFDMAYARGGETSLVKKARAAGLKAVSGGAMLVFQGAEAFHLWTGRKPPIDDMMKVVLAPPL